MESTEDLEPEDLGLSVTLPLTSWDSAELSFKPRSLNR